MFDHFAWSVLVVPLLVLAAAHLVADRLRPDPAARVFAWTTFAVGVSAGVNLLSFALKAPAELPVIATLGGWSHHTVLADTAHVPWVSWLSALWCTAAAIAVTIVLRRRSRALHAADQIATTLPGDAEIVIVPDESVDAFALPSRRGRVVVTTGLRDLLDPNRFAAVVAHERCHLQHRHHDLLWLTRVGAAIHPVLLPMLRRVEYLTERAADEAAAHELGDRHQVATAVGLAALRATTARRPAETLHIGSRPGQIPRRVKALLNAAIPTRFPTAVPALVALSTLVWTGECVYDLQELLRLAAI